MSRPPKYDRLQFRRAYRKGNGNTNAIAELLGCSIGTVHNYYKKFNLRPKAAVDQATKVAAEGRVIALFRGRNSLAEISIELNVPIRTLKAVIFKHIAEEWYPMDTVQTEVKIAHEFPRPNSLEEFKICNTPCDHRNPKEIQEYTGVRLAFCTTWVKHYQSYKQRKAKILRAQAMMDAATPERSKRPERRKGRRARDRAHATKTKKT